EVGGSSSRGRRRRWARTPRWRSTPGCRDGLPTRRWLPRSGPSPPAAARRRTRASRSGSGRAARSGGRDRSSLFVRHQDGVYELRAAPVVPVPVALALEAEALVELDRGLVVGEDVQLELRHPGLLGPLG